MLKLKYLINELVGATIWKLCVSEAEFNNAGDKVPYGYLVILFNGIVTQYIRNSIAYSLNHKHHFTRPLMVHTFHALFTSTVPFSMISFMRLLYFSTRK